MRVQCDKIHYNSLETGWPLWNLIWHARDTVEKVFDLEVPAAPLELAQNGAEQAQTLFHGGGPVGANGVRFFLETVWFIHSAGSSLAWTGEG